MLTFEQFQTNVQQWSEARGIYAHSTALAQALKAVSEVGELADAVIKCDRDALKDAIGDVAVCIVNVAYMIGCDIELSETNYAHHAMGSQSLAAMTSYFVADIASDIAECGEFWKVEVSIENSITFLSCLALDNSLTLIECCESAWHEIKDRKGKMVAGGAFVKDE